MSKRIEHIKSEIIDQYLHDENKSRPWIIGFSGGKDSTVTLSLVWQALLKIDAMDRKRDVHVVCNNTLVENPVIESYVNSVLLDIQREATKQNLPILVHKSLPSLDETFWVKLIGLGYPTPNNQFRWCTERLKIDPTARYIKEMVDERGEAIVLLGSRSTESSNRARTIKKHEILGNRLSEYPNLKNAFVYLPIRALTTEEIWGYINSVRAPWGDDNNKILYNIYADASADDYECPTLVTTKNSPSCGQSRFGCWVCTVVKEDKSTSALIKNGYPWLKPLLDVRNWLADERNKSENRENYRRNGQYLENGGPYTPLYRAAVLERVLEAQKEIQINQPQIELISHQELVAIQILWYRDKIYNYKVSEVYNRIFNKNIAMDRNIEKTKQEQDLLKKSCTEDPEHVNLIEDLIKIQKTKDLMVNKVGLKSGIESRIEDFLSKKENED